MLIDRRIEPSSWAPWLIFLLATNTERTRNFSRDMLNSRLVWCPLPIDLAQENRWRVNMASNGFPKYLMLWISGELKESYVWRCRRLWEHQVVNGQSAGYLLKLGGVSTPVQMGSCDSAQHLTMLLSAKREYNKLCRWISHVKWPVTTE